MKQLSTNEIRQLWLEYFQELNHEIVPSDSLVPANDPTLLTYSVDDGERSGVYTARIATTP